MHVKKLEIQGFKSFADKTILEFMPGITTVIGPNGSGKSNISDAIRWVLGEQSAKSLRGGKMEDIIFTGTSNRKALNFAEVSLTIENDDKRLPVDFAEVVVTRRVYRSGESEYFINKTACRLKDIVELFMGTGIGRDGYSIIGQGKIDEILSNNSDERRNVFEEAAGISKYKARKVEAERKLESTSQNLIRINDILSELEAQLTPLKNQSEKAQQYLALRDELKILEINNFITSTEKIEQDIKNVELHLTELSEELNTKINNSNDTIQKKETAKNNLAETQNKLDETKNSIFEEHKQIDKLTSEITLFTEKTQNNKDNISRIENEILDFTNQITTNSNEKTEREKKIIYLELQKEDYAKILAEKEAEFAELLSSLSGEEQKIENIKQDIENKNDIISEKKIMLNGTLTMITNASQRESQIEKELINISLENDKTNIQAEDIKDNISSINVALSTHNAKIQDINNQKTYLNTEIASLKNKLYSLQSELNIKKSKHKFLLDTENENEGYFKSVKAILDECKNDKNFSKGIHGSLAQLISVPEEFEVAIEMTLASSLQNIITDTQENAKKAIEFLKKINAGRATFLPISAFKPFDSLNENNFKDFSGFIGVASNLIEFNPAYTNIINSLLGKTIIVDTLESAIAISKKSSTSIKIVSLDGDIVNTSGTMSGGSRKGKSDNLLGRRRNITTLESEISDIEKNISNVEAEIKKYSDELINIDTEFNSLAELLKEKEISLAQEKERLNALDTIISTNKGKINYLNIEKREISTQKNALDLEKSETEKAIEALTSEVSQSQAIVNEYKISNKAQMEVRDNLSLDITNYKVSLSSFDESIASVNEILDRINSDLSNAQNAIEKRTKQKEKMLAEIEEFTQKSQVFNKEIANIKEQISSKEEAINTLLQEKENIENQIKSLEDLTLEDIANINETKEKISKVELKKAKLDMDFDNISSKMWEDYQITYSDALKLKQDLDTTNLTSKINKLKNQIRDLGSINIDSIEEYKTISERHSFMSTQRNDLNESAIKLKKVIADMTNTMKDEFISKFNIINKNFGEVFAELFGGGRALIKLADESNVLESGIDIEVQPPGKKLQNMMLLSGGERAFTAIALLFAILKINPAPFCLLDEIEAALDDVNVYRFADYVKNFSDKIQFIIITHRKGTMEAADSIYGVTMEERGVSKLVSMKLTN